MTLTTDNPTSLARDTGRLADVVAGCDSLWQAAMNEHWPAAQCLHWGPWHRVFRFGDRVLKVQHLDYLPPDPNQHVRHEYELLQRIEGRAWRLHPTYQELDGRWSVLGMDWIDGELLSDINRLSVSASVLRTVSAILRISLVGIAHKQLRPRHVMCARDGRIYLIDFGGSARTNTLHALWHNFLPLSYTNRKWRPSAIIGIVMRALRANGHSSPQPGAVALSQWQANRQRRATMRAPYLATAPGDAMAAEQFAILEQACDTAIARDAGLALETWRLQYADYVLFGYQDLGLSAQIFAARMSFTGKRIVEIAAGLAPFSVHGLLNGATSAIAIETEPDLIEASNALAKGFGLTGIHRVDEAPSAVVSSDGHPATGDIAVAVSPRLDRLPVAALTQWLARFDEILLATHHYDAIGAALLNRGFDVVETLSQASASRPMVYARRVREQ